MPKNIKFNLSSRTEQPISENKVIESSIIELPLLQLIPFKNQPFKLYEGTKLEDMLESIKRNGILSPIIVRQLSANQYEILAGHNRVNCANLLEMDKVPCIIKDVDDITATLIMIDTNLNQRECVLPSERAKAYKMKKEMLEKQKVHNEHNQEDATASSTTREKIAKQEGETESQIQRYLRLNNLDERLLQMVDNNYIGLLGAVELSYIKNDGQEVIADVIYPDKYKVSTKQAEFLKDSKDKLTSESIIQILTVKPKVDNRKVMKIPNKKLQKYFKEEQSENERLEIVFKALEMYFKDKNV